MNTISDFCDGFEIEANKITSKSKYPVWFSAWSLSTDSCAQHIEGLNDGKDMPAFTCEWQDCPPADGYLPAGISKDFDRTAPVLTP